MDPAVPREFTDSVGVKWTVREITPGPMPKKLGEMLGDDRRKGPWLLFLSSTGEKRRLAPVPTGWTTSSDSDLDGWRKRAVRVPPAPERRTEDREEDE